MASMSQNLGFITVLLITITVFSHRVESQSTDCTNTIISMASCLNYIQGTAATPPASCCSALANVVQTNPRCLCQVLDGGGSQFGITVNVTQALALPSACSVQTPPISRCHEAAPAPGPDGLSPTGSKVTRGGETSSASVTKNMHLHVLGFIVLLVSSSVAKFSFI